MKQSFEGLKRSATPKRVAAVAAVTLAASGVVAEKAEGSTHRVQHCRSLPSLAHKLEGRIATHQTVPLYTGNLVAKHLQIQIPLVIDRCDPNRDPSAYPADPQSSRYAYGYLNRATHHVRLVRYNEDKMEVSNYYEEDRLVHPAIIKPDGHAESADGQQYLTPSGAELEVALSY